MRLQSVRGDEVKHRKPAVGRGSEIPALLPLGNQPALAVHDQVEALGSQNATGTERLHENPIGRAGGTDDGGVAGGHCPRAPGRSDGHDIGAIDDVLREENVIGTASRATGAPARPCIPGEGPVRVDDRPDVGSAAGRDDRRTRMGLMDRVLRSACGRDAISADSRRQGYDRNPDQKGKFLRFARSACLDFADSLGPTDLVVPANRRIDRSAPPRPSSRTTPSAGQTPQTIAPPRV
jgi:hypothetical protein